MQKNSQQDKVALQDNDTMRSFQDIILKLQKFWTESNCSILQSYDMQMGAGTLSPHTALRVLDSKPWNVCYVQYSRRPTDGRFGQNPNRLSAYYQFQVILKPIPTNIQQLCTQSLNAIGIDTENHDIRFIEDDWENPSIGAAGLGFEVWCDGMEIIQFTYMQKIGGIECMMPAVEVTYGLERVAMYVQNCNSIYDIIWRRNRDGEVVKYSDVHLPGYEEEYCIYNQEYSNDNQQLFAEFEYSEKEAFKLIEKKLVLPAYEFCLKASHILNTLDSRRLLSHNERTTYILRVRSIAKECCTAWLEKYNKSG